MQLDDLITAKDRQMRLPWWGVLCVMLGTLPVILVFHYFGKPALVVPTLSSVWAALAIAMRWQLRRHMWFWVVIAVFVALHVELILVVPWTTQWIPAVLITPIAAVDLWVILATLAVIRKVAAGPKTSER